MSEGSYQIPGPGSAAFLAAAVAAWAASQVNSFDAGGWLIRLFLVAAIFMLAYAGYRVERLHTEFNLRKVQIEHSLTDDSATKRA